MHRPMAKFADRDQILFGQIALHIIYVMNVQRRFAGLLRSEAYPTGIPIPLAYLCLEGARPAWRIWPRRISMHEAPIAISLHPLGVKFSAADSGTGFRALRIWFEKLFANWAGNES